ncbi:MAG: TIGR03862 family flavoprotein [Paracoccaceae bacterium]
MKAAVIGSGPAGLMATDVLAQAGANVTVYEQKPSVGRKFLMAGKSGLNLTMALGIDDLVKSYDQPQMAQMLRAFDAEAVQHWAVGLDQPVFTGSSKRVFPEAMKASPLLRAWLAHLDALGVAFKTRHRWDGWQDKSLSFQTPDGPLTEAVDVVVLAMGGGSWSRLGADGKWMTTLARKDVQLRLFEPSNAALAVNWSPVMQKHFGAPLKSVAWKAGAILSRGEAVLSQKGLEGGGIYTLSPAIRDKAPITLDLLPDLTLAAVQKKLERPRGKNSLSNHMRKALNLSAVKLALAQEWARPLPQTAPELAYVLKHVTVRHAGFQPIDSAISTVGGLPFDALDETLMIKDLPGVFAAGEMLDWDAPTGGYLINGCLATGRWAGLSAARWLKL